MESIAYALIFNRPVIFWLGILTYLGFLSTALIAISNHRQIRFIPFRAHPRIAITSLALGTVHGLLAITTNQLSFLLVMGLLTLALFYLAAAIRVAERMKWRFISPRWHKRLALSGLILATLHGILALTGYF